MVLSKKQLGVLACINTRAEQCQITVRLTTGHFKQAKTVKRKPVTKNPHEFTVQATFCVSVIRLLRTTLPLFPRENKQSTLTNHFGQAGCEPYKGLTAPVERGHIQSEVANTSSSTTLHFKKCQDLGEDDYIVLKGIPTTDFGEQSTPR